MNKQAYEQGALAAVQELFEKQAASRMQELLMRIAKGETSGAALTGARGLTPAMLDALPGYTATYGARQGLGGPLAMRVSKLRSLMARSTPPGGSSSVNRQLRAGHDERLLQLELEKIRAASKPALPL